MLTSGALLVGGCREVEEQREAAAATAAELAGQQARVAELEAHYRERSAELAATEEEVAGLLAELAAARAEADSLRGEMEAGRAEGAPSEEEGELGELRAARDAQAAELAEMRELSRTLASLEDTAAQLAGANARLFELQAEKEELEEQLLGLGEAGGEEGEEAWLAAELEEELAQRNEEMDALMAEVEALTMAAGEMGHGGGGGTGPHQTPGSANYPRQHATGNISGQYPIQSAKSSLHHMQPLATI